MTPLDKSEVKRSNPQAPESPCSKRSFRVLRNQVNQERKTCRAKYDKAKVEHLRKCKPVLWWREVKKLSRMTGADSKNAGSASLFQHTDCSLDNHLQN